MLIEQILPQVVGGTKTLKECLAEEARAQGFSDEKVDTIMAILPERLSATDCFLDKLTGLWRYEFGVPYDLTRYVVWGSHMWVPVKHLLPALATACERLSQSQVHDYTKRLDDPDAHPATLVEMIPAHKVASIIPMKFEVVGHGVGNRTVDWMIEPAAARSVLLDVKRRSTDFIKQAENMGTKGVFEAPDHDVGLLFRSVEQKFAVAAPDVQLQGVWIATDIKQEKEKLAKAFDGLDHGKVHFAILGDWDAGIHVLTRRECDKEFLLKLFRSEASPRFVFSRKKETEASQKGALADGGS